jgi:hypothetical protein
MAYPPDKLPVDLLNETNAETGADDVPGLEAEGGTPGEGEHAKRHNAPAAAINDIVGELGLNPSGVSATVQARLEALGLTLATKADATAVTEALEAKASKSELAAEESARISGLAGKASSVHTHSQYDPYDALPYIVPMGYHGSTTTTLTAKRGYFSRFTVAKKREFKFIRFGVAVVSAAEDKFDVAIFKLNGAKFERLASAGYKAVTTNALGVKAIEMTAAAVCEPGGVYYAGIQPETVTGTPQLVAVVSNNAIVGDIGGTGTLGNRIFLFRNESGAFPTTLEGSFSGAQNPWLVPSEV